MLIIRHFMRTGFVLYLDGLELINIRNSDNLVPRVNQNRIICFYICIFLFKKIKYQILSLFPWFLSPLLLFYSLPMFLESSLFYSLQKSSHFQNSLSLPLLFIHQFIMLLLEFLNPNIKFPIITLNFNSEYFVFLDFNFKSFYLFWNSYSKSFLYFKT